MKDILYALSIGSGDSCNGVRDALLKRGHCHLTVAASFDQLIALRRQEGCDLAAQSIFASNSSRTTPIRRCFVSEMSQAGELVGAQGGFLFEAKAPVTRPASDYTVRVVAALDLLSVPLEEPPILWRR